MLRRNITGDGLWVVRPCDPRTRTSSDFTACGPGVACRPTFGLGGPTRERAAELPCLVTIICDTEFDAEATFTELPVVGSADCEALRIGEATPSVARCPGSGDE